MLLFLLSYLAGKRQLHYYFYVAKKVCSSFCLRYCTACSAKLWIELILIYVALTLTVGKQGQFCQKFPYVKLIPGLSFCVLTTFVNRTVYKSSCPVCTWHDHHKKKTFYWITKSSGHWFYRDTLLYVLCMIFSYCMKSLQKSCKIQCSICTYVNFHIRIE